MKQREYQALFAPCIRLLWDCEYIWCRRQISWQWQVRALQATFLQITKSASSATLSDVRSASYTSEEAQILKNIPTCMVNCQNCQVLFIRSHLRGHCSCTEAIHTYICILKCMKKAHRAENQLTDARSRSGTTEHKKT